MFSLLPLRILYFPCYVEVSLDFELEHIFQKKKNRRFFKTCRMDKLILFLSASVLLLDLLTILIQHFVIQYPQSKK